MTQPKKLPRGRTWESMKQEFFDGVELFKACWNAPIPMICVENPVMHDIARKHMPENLPKPQIVQPHQHGEPEYKATGLYKKNLPDLLPTNVLEQPVKDSAEWKKWNKVHRMPPGPQRGKERSKFFVGIANAMAAQWGVIA